MNETKINTKTIREFTRERAIPSPDVDHVVDFGFRTLDDVTGGLYMDDFVVLAGPAGSGIGTFGSNVILNVARQKVHVLAFLSRITAKDLVKNILDDMSYRKRGKTFEDLQIDSNINGLIIKEAFDLPLYLVELDSGERAGGVSLDEAMKNIDYHNLMHSPLVIYVESLHAMGWGADEILGLRERLDNLAENGESDQGVVTIAGGEIKDFGNGFDCLVDGDAIKEIGAKVVVFEPDPGNGSFAVTARMVTQGPVEVDKFRLRLSPTGSTFEEIL